MCKTAVLSHFKVELMQNLMAHTQKPDFVFRLNGRIHLIGGGVSSVDCWQLRCGHQR